MKNFKIIIYAWLFGFLFYSGASGHEPIYGNGPHVLFKGGFAPGITLQSYSGFFETEYSLEYGLTNKLTVGTDLIFNTETNSYGYEGIKLKGKYRFYTKYSRGSMLQFSALAGIMFPNNGELQNAINLGIAAGTESVDFYWFASALYLFNPNSSGANQLNSLNYDLTLGYRVTELDYYKPDLVLFVEFIGKHKFGSSAQNNWGNAWSVAPTLMFTFRNYALRSGVEFGVENSGAIPFPKTNFKISIETHI